MKKHKSFAAYGTDFVLSFVAMFAIGILALYPADIWRSFITALILSTLLVAFDRFIKPTGNPVKVAARMEHLLITKSLPNKKERAKRVALIALFFISFTVVNVELLRFVTGGADLRIFLASPIIGALYTYGFITFLRKRQQGKK